MILIIMLVGERNSLSLYFELFSKDDFTPHTMTMKIENYCKKDEKKKHNNTCWLFSTPN